jgi:hypothetical protein
MVNKTYVLGLHIARILFGVMKGFAPIMEQMNATGNGAVKKLKEGEE